MPTASFDLAFQWHVSVEGYRCLRAIAVESDGEPSTFIATGIPTGGAVRLRRYFPFEHHTGLFRDFGALKPDEDSIRSFADRYGLLGGSANTAILLGEPGSSSNSALASGERLSRWRAEIGWLRHCLQLYDLVQTGDFEGLGRHIIWDDKGVRYASHPDAVPFEEIPKDEHFSFTVIASTLYEDPNLQRFVPGDLVKPALFYLQKQINKRLKEETGVRILWDKDGNDLVNCAVPNGLLGAMWLQFALSVERKSTFRQCPQCGKWFEVSPKTARSDKVFCSTICRVKASRRRLAETASGGEAGEARPASKTSKAAAAQSTTKRKTSTQARRRSSPK